MPTDSSRIEIPKTLQERMLKFFLKTEAQRRVAKNEEETCQSEKPQNPIEISNDRSSGSD